jgi:hypothetical protein
VPKSTKSPPTAAAAGRGPSAAAGHGPPARVAGRPATGVEAAAIRQAVTVSALISLAPAGGYRVTGIRVSRAVPAWAFALIEPAGDDLDPAVVVVHRTGTTSWTVEQIGTDAVGCGAAPREVLEEFAVDCRS